MAPASFWLRETIPEVWTQRKTHKCVIAIAASKLSCRTSPATPIRHVLLQTNMKPNTLLFREQSPSSPPRSSFGPSLRSGSFRTDRAGCLVHAVLQRQELWLAPGRVREPLLTGSPVAGEEAIINILGTCYGWIFWVSQWEVEPWERFLLVNNWARLCCGKGKRQDPYHCSTLVVHCFNARSTPKIKGAKAAQNRDPPNSQRKISKTNVHLFFKPANHADSQWPRKKCDPSVGSCCESETPSKRKETSHHPTGIPFPWSGQDVLKTCTRILQILTESALNEGS